MYSLRFMVKNMQIAVIDVLLAANLIFSILIVVLLLVLASKTDSFKTQLTVFEHDVKDLRKTAAVLEAINKRIPTVEDIALKIRDFMPGVASEIFKKTIHPLMARTGKGVQGTIKQILQAKNPVYGELYKQAPKFVKDWIASNPEQAVGILDGVAATILTKLPPNIATLAAPFLGFAVQAPAETATDGKPETVPGVPPKAPG